MRSKPDFQNLLDVLKRKKPKKPTLYELYMNPKLYHRLAASDMDGVSGSDPLYHQKVVIYAFGNAGYDYAVMGSASPMYRFRYDHIDQLETRSLNQGMLITDEKSFGEHVWPEPEDFDYSELIKVNEILPDGMKVVVNNTESVFMGVVRLMGFDNLCYAIHENEPLVKAMFDATGSRILKLNQICASMDSVGAIVVSDDWGFNSQTMISPALMRKYVFPWHKKTVDAIHSAGKPAILHSCGNLKEVYNDIIDDMGYDGKHSFQDAICPVEDIYDAYSGRIAILGGIDMDYLIRKTPEEIEKRALALLERTGERGGYALGSGNSIPEAVPYENYMAMVNATHKFA